MYQGRIEGLRMNPHHQVNCRIAVKVYLPVEGLAGTLIFAQHHALFFRQDQRDRSHFSRTSCHFEHRLFQLSCRDFVSVLIAIVNQTAKP